MEVCLLQSFIAITQDQLNANRVVFQRVRIITREKKKEEKRLTIGILAVGL